MAVEGADMSEPPSNKYAGRTKRFAGLYPEWAEREIVGND